MNFSSFAILLLFVSSVLGLMFYKDYSEQKKKETQRIEGMANAAENVRKTDALAKISISRINGEWEEAFRLQKIFIESGHGFDEAVIKFTGIVSMGDPHFAAVAEMEISRMNKIREIGISKVLSEIEDESETMAGQSRFADAAALCKTYSGIYRQETEAKRLVMADKYDRLLKISDVKKKYDESKDRKLSDIANLLALMKYKDALELARNPGIELSSPDAEEFQSIAKSMEQLASIEDIIADNLKKIIGNKVVFASRGGMASGTVSSVSGSSIYVNQNFEGKIIQTKTTYGDLAVPSRLECVKKSLQPVAYAIHAAILYAGEGKRSHVKKCLGSAGLLARYLEPIILKGDK